MFIELLINGLAQGSLLALIAIGYSLAYGSAKVINFPHADILITGGGYLVLLWIAGASGLPLADVGMATLFGLSAIVTLWPWDRERIRILSWKVVFALILGVLIFTFTILFTGKLPFIIASLLAIPLTALLATAVYRVGYLNLLVIEAPRTSILLSALGFVIAIESLLLIFWGAQRRVFLPNFLPEWLVVKALPENISSIEAMAHFGTIPISSEITLPVYDAIIIIAFVFVSIFLHIFFRFSRVANAIVGVADSRIAARSCGIPVNRILGYSFFVGGAIASIGGTLYILRAKTMSPTSGFSLGILAFVACVLGGIGSLRGSIMGAFLVSLMISFAPAIPLHQWLARFIPHEFLEWLPSLNLNDWSYGVVYLLMIIVIFVKPKGLFSE